MREEQMQEAPVKVLLVGVDIGEEADFEHSMEELASLAEAAEKEVVGQIVQRLDHVNKALYIGTGIGIWRLIASRKEIIVSERDKPNG